MRVLGAAYVVTILMLMVAAPTYTTILASQSISENGGNAYTAAIDDEHVGRFIHSDDSTNGWQSGLRLYENGVPLGPAHTLHQAIRDQGRGAYSHWVKTLVFAASDNSDPRTNGRIYTVAVPLSVPAALFLPALLVVTWLLLDLVGVLGRKAHAWAQDSPRLADVRNATDRETLSARSWTVLLVPLALAASPSILLFAAVPPLYTDMTIVSAVANPAAMMPHYPPLYAYFVRVTHVVANAACGLPDGLSNCGLYTMTLAQHVILIAAIWYFVSSCAETLSRRIAAMAPFYVMPAFLLVNHGLQTEAIWLSCLIVVLGATIRLLRGRTGRATFVTLCAALTAAVLIRPTTLFLAPVIPAALTLHALVERTRRSLATLALGITALVIGVMWGQLATGLTFAAHGIEYRSSWGRGTIEVVQRIVWRLETGDQGHAPVQRSTLVPALEASARDPLLRNAIPTIVAYLDADYEGTGKTTVWGGAHYQLMRSGTRDGGGSPVVVDFAMADRLVNQFCVLFIRTYPELIADYARRTAASYVSDAFGLTGESGLQTTMAAKIAALRFVADGSGNGLPGVQSLAMAQQNTEIVVRYQRFSGSSLFRMLASVSDAQWAGVLIVVLTAGLVSRRLSRAVAVFVLATSLTIIFYVGVTSTLLAFIRRYELP